jgi:DNA-binding MarR family transcriptional regulator
MKIRQYVGKSLLFALGSGYEKIWRGFSSSLRKEEVNFLQAVILISMLFEEESEKPVTPSSLADALRTSRGNISHCISALEKGNFLKRAFDPKDARRYQLTLRPEGRRTALRLMKIIDQTESFFEKKFGEKSVQDTIDSISAFEKAYSESL